MSQNISEPLHNVQPLERPQAHRALLLAQPGNPGDGDWPPVRTYWEGYTEGREAGEQHGRNLAEIENAFAVDDAERRGYQRGKAEAETVTVLLKKVGEWLVWLVIWGLLILWIGSDLYKAGKEAGQKEMRQTSQHDKIGMMIEALPR